jgi:hypothetical protein
MASHLQRQQSILLPVNISLKEAKGYLISLKSMELKVYCYLSDMEA